MGELSAVGPPALREPGEVSWRILSPLLPVWPAYLVARGYGYRTPEEARDSLDRRFLENKRRKGASKEEFRKREKRVAVADGEYAIEADVPGAAVRARHALTATLPKKDQAVLAELASYQSEAVKRAEAILGR